MLYGGVVTTLLGTASCLALPRLSDSELVATAQVTRSVVRLG